SIKAGFVNIVAVIRSSPLAGLCYDTLSVKVVLFPVDTPDKTPSLGCSAEPRDEEGPAQDKGNDGGPYEGDAVHRHGRGPGPPRYAACRPGAAGGESLADRCSRGSSSNPGVAEGGVLPPGAACSRVYNRWC